MKLRKVITTAGFMFAGVSSTNAQLYMCQSCPAGTYSDGTFTECKNCLTTGVANCDSITGKATSCKPGYGLSNGTCSACPSGYYSASDTETSCSTCPAGYYCPGGTDKKICSAGTYSTAGASSCSSCNPSTTSGGSGCGRKSVSTTSYCTVSGSTSATANPKTTSSYKTLTCSSGYVCISGSCKKSTSKSISCYSSGSIGNAHSGGASSAYWSTGSSVSVTLGSRVPSCSSGWPTEKPSYGGLTGCPGTGCVSVAGKYWCGGSTYQSSSCQ